MVLVADDDYPESQNRWDATGEAHGHTIGLAAPEDADGSDKRFLESKELDGDNAKSVEKLKEILIGINKYVGRSPWWKHIHRGVSERRSRLTARPLPSLF